MPVVTRDDGTQFAVFTYRELVLSKKGSDLVEELEAMEEQHGSYARFFIQATGDYEVVFSKDPGYLLGESIWEHFDRPYNLIFCETVPDTEDVMLIVIRGGAVYLDQVVTIDNLVDEFVSLSADGIQYEIYTYGELPIAVRPEGDKFVLDASSVKSFKRLTSPVLHSLILDDDLKLIPVDEAIEELDLPSSNLTQYIIGFIVLGIIAFGVIKFLTPEEVVIAPTKVWAPPPTDPWGGYKQALQTPAPNKQVLEVVQDTLHLITIPGWEPTKIDFNGLVARATLNSNGASSDILVAWVRESHDILEVTGGKARVTMPSNVPARDEPTKIYSIRDMVTRVYDGLNLILPSGSVSIGDTVDEGNYVATDIGISFSGITTSVLILIAEQLEGLPIVLESMNFSIQNGLLTGTMQLKVLGARG